MIENLIVSFLLLGVTFYLSANRNSKKNKKFDFDEENSNSLIEFLTQHKTVEKNYSNSPEQFTPHGYWRVKGEITGDVAVLNYTFPLINKVEHEFVTTFDPEKVSTIVSQFVHEGGGLPDFKKLVLQSQELGAEIADSILKVLELKNNDTYFNRVQATLNFVQFIPYGIPNFDHGNYLYGGVSIPHESLILSYSDCDSKSILFATILMNLIDKKNIVLIVCNMSSNSGHMVVGVSGLNSGSGVEVEYNNKNFLVLETTSPVKIGTPIQIEVNEIIPLI